MTQYLVEFSCYAGPGDRRVVTETVEAWSRSGAWRAAVSQYDQRRLDQDRRAGRLTFLDPRPIVLSVRPVTK